ncbi:MAG: DUF1684 domain-containing protein [Proteobacteria bacterium]|nr:DUF1684 domain-containing protein [Pseudomonadota bacterium]
MIRIVRYTGIAALVLAAGACGRAGPEPDPAAYKAEIAEWRAGRLERLLKPTGYLTQIGLYWLEDGNYPMGSSAGNRIVLPGTAAAHVGDLVVADGAVRMIVAPDVAVLDGERAVSDIVMPADTSGEILILSHGSIAWSIIERAGKLAVRIRDFGHPFAKTFGPLPYYEIDPGYRVRARLHYYDEPRTVAVDTVIEGFQQFPVAPGVAAFAIDGREYRLEPTISGDWLFFVFGDDTNRDDTYGAGRFLYADMPGEDGEFVLDFNKSYSPPCAFNDFSTCPVASPGNRLPVRIEAGERFEPYLHYSGDPGRQKRLRVSPGPP